MRVYPHNFSDVYAVQERYKILTEKISCNVELIDKQYRVISSGQVLKVGDDKQKLEDWAADWQSQFDDIAKEINEWFEKAFKTIIIKGVK